MQGRMVTGAGGEEHCARSAPSSASLNNFVSKSKGAGNGLSGELSLRIFYDAKGPKRVWLCLGDYRVRVGVKLTKHGPNRGLILIPGELPGVIWRCRSPCREPLCQESTEVPLQCAVFLDGAYVARPDFFLGKSALRVTACHLAYSLPRVLSLAVAPS